MNSNVKCARAAGVNSAANKHEQQQTQQPASASIAVVEARRADKHQATTRCTTNQTNALKSGCGVDRLATGGSCEQHILTEWLQCGRTSANQLSGERHCGSENLCSKHEASHHSEKSPLATNNSSSRRGDAAGPPRRLNCSVEGRQQRLRQRRRQWSERSQRATTSSSSGGSGAEAAAAAAAPVFCCAAEPASRASANRSTSRNNIQMKSAHERRAEDLKIPTGQCEGEPDATFWAKLSNLSRSIIHQRQQQAAAAAAAAASRSRAAVVVTLEGATGIQVIGCGGGGGGGILAPEVVGYLESKRRRGCGGTKQCAVVCTTKQEEPPGPIVDADERHSSKLLRAQTARGPEEEEAMKGENMTTIKMASNDADEQSAPVSQPDGNRRAPSRTKDERTRVIKSVELQRPRTIKAKSKTMHQQDQQQHQQQQPQQQQVTASSNYGKQQLPADAASSLEQLARKQAAGSTRQQQNQMRDQAGQRTAAGKHQPTTSNTTTTNTASSSTTRDSSASSLSSCILTETSTARSDRTQDAGGGGGGGGVEGGGACESAGAHDEVRLKWDKKMDFLLSIIGFAVDLANIWRFPYLVYKNGGGVFLIPYLTMLVFGGLPLFFLELCLGQYVKKGSITLWDKICPYMKGVGYCSMLVSWYVSFYYNVLIAWSVYFIYRSVTSIGEKMPWEDCDNPWNSPTTCVSISQLKGLCALRTNETLESCRKDMFSAINVTSPASEFFVKELSQIDQSSGLEDMGYLRTELVLCTLVVYLLHYFSLFRGLETSGKVVWVTATAPYMILSILLVRGLFLPGASMGIKYYLSPRLEKLADPQVWIDAAGQVFYSIGVGFGVHLTYASFNPHNNNCHRDCLVTTAVNALTSVYSGLVVFVYLGYMAANLGIEIDKVASEGYSLVFEVYPEALTTLPFARFWSILFFIMLLTLGIDSAMAALEAVITGLEDEFIFFKRMTRAQLTALVIVSSFLPALISCTQGGAYTLFWFDIYSAGVSLLFAAFFETIGVVYCYGLDKFIVNIESMLGKKPHMFYILCWKYISPIFLMGIIFMSIYTAQVPVYRGYTFPRWSIILGWCLAFSSVSAVPIVALCTWCSRVAAGRDKAISVSPSKSPRKLGGANSEKSSLAAIAASTIMGHMTAAAVISLASAPDTRRHQRHRLNRYETSDPSLDDVREEMV